MQNTTHTVQLHQYQLSYWQTTLFCTIFLQKRTCCWENWDSSVSVISWLQVGQCNVPFPEVARDIADLQNVQTGSRTHSLDTRGTSLRVWRSPLRMMGAIALLLLCAFMAYTQTKLLLNFLLLVLKCKPYCISKLNLLFLRVDRNLCFSEFDI